MTCVVKKSLTEDRYMQYHPNDGIIWIDSTDKANYYPSRYAAKQHCKVIPDLSTDAVIVEI